MGLRIFPSQACYIHRITASNLLDLLNVKSGNIGDSIGFWIIIGIIVNRLVKKETDNM